VPLDSSPKCFPKTNIVSLYLQSEKINLKALLKALLKAPWKQRARGAEGDSIDCRSTRLSPVTQNQLAYRTRSKVPWEL
jgi:hypothetical protein